MNLSKKFYTESKQAEYRFERNDDFHLAWVIGDKGQPLEVLSVEYIPANYPGLTMCVYSLKEYKKKILKTLKEIGFTESNKW